MNPDVRAAKWTLIRFHSSLIKFDLNNKELVHGPVFDYGWNKIR